MSIGTTTEDLRIALAEVDAAAAQHYDSADDTSSQREADRAKRADDAEAAAMRQLLQPFVETIMDVTIGRFQAVQFSATAVPQFIRDTSLEVERLLKESATALRQSGAKLDDTLASQLLTAQSTIEDFREQKNRLRASEMFLRSLGSELIRDVSGKTEQLLALQGVVKRRDGLLSEQRKQYLRELTHLRAIIHQLESKGSSGLSDATFYNWNQDDLAAQMDQEAGEANAAILQEERAKFAKELETQEAKFAKMEEDLRRQLVALDAQLRQLRAPVPSAEEASQTDMSEHETADCSIQTNDVVVVDELPTPVDVDQLVCPHCTSRYGAPVVKNDPASPPLSPRRSDASSPPQASPKKKATGKKRPGSSGLESPRPPSSPQTPTIDSGVTAAALDADVAALRAQLAEQRALAEELRNQIAGKSNALTAASKRKMETDDARRRAELQLVRKLQEDVRAKDLLLEQKSRELSQLEEETRRWFEQYKQTQPSDQVPVNYATLRKVHDAVEAAEESEQRYREMSWTLLAAAMRHRTILEGLRTDCVEAERLKDPLALRAVQRAFDAVSLQVRQRAARLRLKRSKHREEANRAWDTVLYFARMLHHPTEALPPPPRYYAIGDGPSSAGALPSSPQNRSQELLAVMHRQAVVTHKDALLSQQLKLGPAAGPAVAHPELLDGVLTPRSTRPGTAPVARVKSEPTVLEGEGSSPYVVKVRTAVASSGDASRRGQRPALSVNQRPSSALYSPKAPTFSPSGLRGMSAAAKRQALVQLMRHDQDLLAVHNKRHIESTLQSRASRAASFMSNPSDAGVYMHKLVGRMEHDPGA